jgi:hypothetical protein
MEACRKDQPTCTWKWNSEGNERFDERCGHDDPELPINAKKGPSTLIRGCMTSGKQAQTSEVDPMDSR